MAKILLMNPSKMGSGYTPIWIASHAAVLKNHGHEVMLFDACLYESWVENYNIVNTQSDMYQYSDYEKYVQLKKSIVTDDLQKIVSEFDPDIIFWSAISSHIHSEGEYVNMQYGSDLLNKINTSAIKITGGIQVTANPMLIADLFGWVDFFIQGESEFVLQEFVSKVIGGGDYTDIKGLVWRDGDEVVLNSPQDIIGDLDDIPFYDYSIFSNEVLYRSYNGKVYKAVDYEMSRGCPYSCNYCVETVIQKYYGLDEVINKGVIAKSNKYLRSKSSKRIFNELKFLSKEMGVNFIRCQDTNFLTIPRKTLEELADLIDKEKLDIFLYIETRAENIASKKVVSLLKRLKVDGVAMGIETASEGFREDKLNRFSAQSRIKKAFMLLKEAGIKRTSYNIIGLPGETEEMIKKTIEFNRSLNPDNVSTSFYTPYIGTALHSSALTGESGNVAYQFNLDDGLRCSSPTTDVSKNKLESYRRYYTHLVRNGLEDIDNLISEEGDI